VLLHRLVASALPALLGPFALLTLATSPLAAQPPGRTAVVDVRVLDQSGGVVTEAEVLVARGSEASQAALAVEPGRYVLSGLLPGRYLITVAKAGFAAISVEAAAYVGRTVTVPVTLEPAALTDLVTVEAVVPAGSTAYKLPATLHETPRSLTIMDSARMRAQNLRSVPEALAYVPGMFVNSYRTEGYHFYARGYRMGPEDTRIDGFAGINAGGGFGASLFGVEQAVVLRGPAGLLYGSAGSPGGLINLVTKKPLDVRRTQLDVRTGGYAGRGVSLGERGTAAFDLDSTGPLTRDGRVLYRALVTTENASYFTNDVIDQNRYANASITWRLDRHGRVTLTPIAQWSRLNRPAGGGIVVSPSTSLTTSDGVAGPINMADLSPHDVNLSSGGRIDETFWTGADFRAQATRALTLNASYRFIRFDTDVDQFRPQVTTSAQIAALRDLGLVERVHSKSGNDRRYHNFDVNGTYELRPSSSWKSLVQVGLNGRLATLRATSPAGPTPSPQSPLNVYTGETRAPLVPNYPALAWGAPADDRFWNTYVQNQTSLAGGKVVATVGLGYGENDPAVGAVRTSDVMPNAALVVNATRSLALFGSYATSYNPTDPASESALGERGTFGPAVGENLEIGAKYDLPGRRASWSLSWFRNQIDNALVQSGPADLNPNGNRYYVEAGTRRSRGVELSAEMRPLDTWLVTGAVSYLNAIYTGEAPPSAAVTAAIPGSRAEKSPEWSWSLWTRYDRPEGRLRGLGAALGLIWQAERLGGNGARTPAAPDPLVLPAFTRVDAALFYRVNQRMDLSLNLENLLDETIFVSGTVGSSLEVAAPRTIAFRVGYRLN